MTDQHHDAGCPLENVHRRMNDAHMLWHQALDWYFSPDQFRPVLQSCIQTLRTVTWLLQNNKRAIPDFDPWYGGWQKDMKADPIMRWAVEARNQIEKQGDLETYSRVRAQLIASYLNDLPIIEVKTNLFDDLDALFKQIPRDLVANQILEYGMLKIERRWVANSLPEQELLDALAHVYGKLWLLLSDAHRQMSLPVPMIMETHGEGSRPFPGGGPEDGRLPCMVSAHELRYVYVSLKTGQPTQYTAIRHAPTRERMETAKALYGPILERTAPKEIKTLRDLANWYFSIAREIFVKDGYHVSIAILIRELHPVLHIETRFEDRSDKYVIMRHVAAEVERYNADAVIHISEAWQAIYDPKTPYAYPSDRTDRSEHLALNACSKDGQFIDMSAEIARDGTRPWLRDTVEMKMDLIAIFEPILEVWRRSRSDK